MATKLRNKNQKTNTTPAEDLDKQDPLDLKPLNSEPKAKSKSKKSRVQERLEREKLLQQHRLHQQESLKRQREREHVEKAPLPIEPNQHTQLEQQASTTAKTPSDILNGNEQPGNKARDPVTKSANPGHESLNKNDEGIGALGDSISRNTERNHQRCTNCCGRPQVRRNRSLEKSKPTEGTRSGTGVDRCSLEQTNVEDGDEKYKSEGCRCHCNKKERIYNVKTTSFHSCEATQSNHPRLCTENAPHVQKMQNFKDEDETRLRGGCGGGCSGGRSPACCPCGGCGGAACATNTGCGNRPPVGCCGGNQSRGLPCRCKCKSCSPCPPCGTCGGQNCGKWNSCAGSGGGKCCFPRNTRRHNGADCCGGCGGCC